MASPKIAVIVPTLDAGALWSEWLEAYRRQTLVPEYALVVDSSSSDATPALARQAGIEVVTISRAEFNHGGTRQCAIGRLPAEVELVILITQDAVMDDERAFANLVAAFTDPAVGAAYGRQLPRTGASPIESHARLFNYPSEGRVKSVADIPVLGFKTTFISNSFAAYRRSALNAVGGFPSDVILSEDTYVAAKMLLAGWKLAYCAEAKVRHSHDYSIVEEFKRYFDVGVFHAKNRWIKEAFGGAEGEGRRFVNSEMKYLAASAPVLLPSALLRTVLKYAGFSLGMIESALPLPLKRRISMHRRYWDGAGA